MTRKPKRPRTCRGRAPWRWHWGRIALVPVIWTGWFLALRWSLFFGIALSFYIYAQLRAAMINIPAPPPGSERGSEDEEAGQFTLTQDDPDKPNHWKVTHSD